MKINGKVIVVTGGGNGVGRQLTLQLLAKGAKVAAVDINQTGLEETRTLAGKEKQLSLHRVDITDLEAVQNLVKEVETFHGAVDGVINNAGIIQPFVKIEEMEIPQIERVMNVNFYGTLYMVKAFLPILKRRSEAHITNVSSMGGFLGVPGQSAYGASKAAVTLLTKGLMSELKGTNVGISLVIPGGIATDIIKNSNVESTVGTEDSKMTNMLLTPEKAAQMIIESIEKNKRVRYIGKDCKSMNILNRFSPKTAAKLINKALAIGNQ